MSRRVDHKRPSLRAMRWRTGWLRRPSRRAAAVGLGAVGLVLLASPVAEAASDLFQNIGPASQLPGGSLTDAYPLGNYALDHHFDAVKAGVFSGIDVSGIPPTIAWMLANVTWQITAFLAHTVITLFTFAFSLDLVNGSQATGGAGALEPVSDAVRSIYQTTFGAPWLVVAILLAGLWAIYQALVRRRYTETAGSLALSVLLVVIALAFVTQPEQTIGAASRWSNEMSGAFLSLTSKGTVSNQAQAKRNAADQLFALLIYQPWSVLQFGGLEHCVKTPVDGDDPRSVAVRPLSRDSGRDSRLSGVLRRTGQVQGDGKACVNNEHKYAPHFLRFGTGSDERNKEHDALAAGDTGKLPDADSGKKEGSYRLSAVDKPAAEAMGKNGQYQRLLLSLVVFLAELGAFLLLGALSIGVILAQVLVLLLLAFAPIALVVAVFPGRGHEFFLGWLTRLATFLLRKAMYSLVLAVLLAVGAALANASANLGWLMAFGLQAVFFWAVFLTRHQLVGHLTMATTGHRGRGEGDAVRLAALYGSAHAIKSLMSRRKPPPPPPPSGGPSPAPDAGRQLPPTTPPPVEVDPGAPLASSGAPSTVAREGAGHVAAVAPPSASTRPTTQTDEQANRTAASQDAPAAGAPDAQVAPASASQAQADGAPPPVPARPDIVPPDGQGSGSSPGSGSRDALVPARSGADLPARAGRDTAPAAARASSSAVGPEEDVITGGPAPGPDGGPDALGRGSGGAASPLQRDLYADTRRTHPSSESSAAPESLVRERSAASAHETPPVAPPVVPVRRREPIDSAGPDMTPRPARQHESRGDDRS